MAADAPGLDLFSADTSTALGVPKAFRIENHTNHAIYLQADAPVDCQVGGTSGWQSCTYFHSCTRLCPQVQEKQSCCVYCEQSLGVYAIPAGQGRSIPWDGLIFVRQTGTCSECQCDQPIPVTGGDFEATARIYIDYTCRPGICTIPPDGFINTATTVGSYLSFRVPFSVPFAGEELVIDVSQASPLDASPPDVPVGPDSKTAVDSPADFFVIDTASTRDLTPQPTRATPADLAGRQFTIAADEALPDASLYGRSCGTSNPGAHYRLTFSDDGTHVTVVRADPIQETILTGTLGTGSSTTLDYELTPTFAGGSLSIRREGNDLIGNLSIHGSGVPVIWCIESPMRPV
jgi:hypothetical protein